MRAPLRRSRAAWRQGGCGALHQGAVPEREPGRGKPAQRAHGDPHHTTGRSRGRLCAGRGPPRPTHRLRPARRAAGRYWPAHRHHPLRLAGRRLFSGRLCTDGDSGAADGGRRNRTRRPVGTRAGPPGLRAMNIEGRQTVKMRRARVRRPRMPARRLSHLSVNRMVPNILTLLALCAGMTAMRFAMGGNFEGAVFAIIAAGIFDGLDGRMARLLKATSSFGAELDSLSDFVSFGVAPAAVLYLWTMSELHVLGWAIVLFFAVCCALRLARFNAGTNAEMPSYAAPFFSGAPAPAGAGLVMIPMFLSFEWGDWLFRSPYLSAITITGIALLMVSKVPTVSLKRIRIPQHMVIPTLLAFGVATAFLTTAPWPTLMVVGVVYLGSIPLTIRSYFRLRRVYRARKAEAGEPAQALPIAAPESIALGQASPAAGDWRR